MRVKTLQSKVILRMLRRLGLADRVGIELTIADAAGEPARMPTVGGQAER